MNSLSTNQVARERVATFQRKHRIGLLVLLFTDIVGSTRIKQELGDVAGSQLIREHLALVRNVLAEFAEAEEINFAGDGFFIVMHVLFYDLIDGEKVVQTSADVKSRWISPPVDWTEGETEELAVEYRLAKPGANATPRENRKYFGYIVRIYYQERLQAVAAEPERLAQQYPPPTILPK